MRLLIYISYIWLILLAASFTAVSLHAGTTQKSECPTILDCPTPQPLTCPPEPTPESIPGSVAIKL